MGLKQEEDSWKLKRKTAMKRILMFLLFGMLTATGALSQVDILVIGGPSFSNFIGSERENWGGVNEKPKMAIRVHIGVQISYPINEQLSAISGLQFSTKGATYSGSPFEIEEEYNKVLSYLDIPLNVQYALSEKFSLQGGFQASILVSAKVKNGEEVQDAYQLPATEDAKDDYKGFDLAINIGPVYKISDKLAAQLMYQHGLSKIGQYAENGADVTYDVKNQVIKLSLTYIIKKQ
jgi:hypothetical protein